MFCPSHSVDINPTKNILFYAIKTLKISLAKFVKYFPSRILYLLKFCDSIIIKIEQFNLAKDSQINSLIYFLMFGLQVHLLGKL